MIPLYSSSQVRSADEYAIKKLKIPSIALMENASRSIYSVFLEKFPDITTEDQIGILCGKGNNGGDGFALARHFFNDGFKVKIVLVGKPSELSRDAKINYDICAKLAKRNKQLSIILYKKKSDISTLKNTYAVFDALLGTGAKGSLREPYKTIVETINQFISFRIAVDLPTGLDVDKGTGDVIFNADLTITLAEFKTGLFFENGYSHSGEIEKGYIGIGAEYFENLEVHKYLVEPEDAYLGLPLKSSSSHKYSAGKVLSIAGSGKLPGAACLTANSALYGGAGASILAFPNSIKNVAQKQLHSAIVESYNDNGQEYLQNENLSELKERIKWADVIAIGPGLGREVKTQRAVLEIIEKAGNKKIIIDADAVFALSEKKYLKVNCKNKVFTPHHGEFAQLIKIPLEELKSDLIKHGKKFVEETGAYLVLKGAPTIIFTPNSDMLINTTGNAGMATFGSGDVLTGLIAAFASQQENIESAVISAVYIHSLAADLLLEEFTEHGITANSIMQNIPKAIKFVDDTISKIFI